jgi:hypothetical protein
VPEHVVILGLGPSLECYVDVVKRMGNRRWFADEVWGINAAANVIECDRVFHMDDVRIQEIRAAAAPESNIAAMLEWLKSHPGPVYTSRAHPGLSGACRLSACRCDERLRWLGIFQRHVCLRGCVRAFPRGQEAHAVRLRLLLRELAPGRTRPRLRRILSRHVPSSRHGLIGLPNTTSLLDAVATNGQRLYGYDTVTVAIDHDADDKIVLEFTPRETLPSAAEIEHRYDHSQPTSPHVRAAQTAK